MEGGGCLADGYVEPYEEDYITKISLAWGNILGSLDWDYKFNDDLSVRNIAYYSGSRSGLGMTEEDIDKDKN